jgi:hypothetical protein
VRAQEATNITEEIMTVKLKSASYTPTFYIEISGGQLALLRYRCLTHYDGTVRGLAEPGPDAIVNAWWNTWYCDHLTESQQGDSSCDQSTVMKGDPRTIIGKASFRQLDLLCKAVENARTSAEVVLQVAMNKLRNFAADAPVPSDLDLDPDDDLVHLELAIRVLYDRGTITRKEATENLASIARNAANNGLLTGDGPATADEWNYTVRDLSTEVEDAEVDDGKG